MRLRCLRLSRRSASILLALVLLALGFDFVFFTGYYGSDDLFYLEGARAVAGDGDFFPELGSVRLGITLPSALVYRLTGSIGAVAWFHVLYHLGLVVVAYVLGRLLHGERAGLIAAGLAAINPLYYVFAGAVLPDNATAFWLGVAMIALVATRRRGFSGDGLLSWNRSRFVGYLTAGVLLGLCYTCKETALIMTVPAAVFIMTSPPGLRNLVWVQNGAALALGLVLIVVLDYLVLRVVAGEWIFRLSMVADAGVIFTDEMKNHSSPFERVEYAYDELGALIPITLWLLVAGSISYGFVRDRSAGIVMFFWWPAVYLTVGTTSFTTYIPPTVQSRYYAIALLPAIVMTATVIGALIENWSDAKGSKWRQRFGAHLVAGCALTLVGGYEVCSNIPNSGMIYRANEARAFVAALDLARERYPQYAVVASVHYQGRMRPLMFDLPIKLEAAGQLPPYLFVDLIDHSEASRIALESPTSCAVRLHDIPPPRSRSSILADAVRRMFAVAPRRLMRASYREKSGAALILVEPRVANQPCRSGS